VRHTFDHSAAAGRLSPKAWAQRQSVWDLRMRSLHEPLRGTPGIQIFMSTTATTLAFALRAIVGTTCSMTDCDGVVIEANIPVPASPGAGVVAVDGERVWVSQDSVAIRFTKKDGVWGADAFLAPPGPNPPPDPKFFDAANGRVIYGGSIFGPSEPYQVTCSVDSACAQPGLGTNFRVSKTGMFCLAYQISSVTPGGGSFFVPGPSVSSGSAVGVAAQGQFGYAWLKSDPVPPTINGKVSVWRWTVEGNETHISSVGGGGYPLGPDATAVYDLAPVDAGVAVIYQPPWPGTLSVAVFADGEWETVPSTWNYPGRIAEVGGRIFVMADHRLWEVVRKAPGDWFIRDHLQLGYSYYTDLDGDGSLLAATVQDPSVASGVRVVIMRLATSIDCDSDGTPDCEELASGAPDVNGNGTPDECECLADLFVDGDVNGADLGIALSQWGQGKGSVADINRDGTVNGADLSILLSAWGACP
jgi:hypothetical protein